MKPNIAILDDSPMMTAFFNRQLGKENKLAFYTNSNLAIKSFLQKKPNLILLDWGLSGVNKVALIKMIKRRKELCDIPLLVLSGNNTPDFHQKCLALGVQGILLKPFQPHELQYYINEQLAVTS